MTTHYWIERSARPFLAVNRVSLDIRPGEFVAIVGPSSCGKTTFLNAVDGLLPISGGALELTSKVFVGLVIVATTGVVLTLILSRIERRFQGWKPNAN